MNGLICPACGQEADVMDFNVSGDVVGGSFCGTFVAQCFDCPGHEPEEDDQEEDVCDECGCFSYMCECCDECNRGPDDCECPVECEWCKCLPCDCGDC